LSDKTVFYIGQRWVSNSEAELGLGLITENSGRRIEVLFPATGEQRTYAADIAPLSRVNYPVGEQVNTNEGVAFTITARHELNGCFVYQGNDKDGNEISIHEMDLDSSVHFSQPQDRLFAGQIDKNSRFELRIAALAHQHRLQQLSSYGLMGARAELLPHQIYIASKVAQRYAPRILLADEVGLGKTIEAGLILHQQLLTGRAERVLIVVPDSLVHQWLVEMLRRFNLSFTIMDAERCHAITEAEEGNPFESAQLILCSLSLLTEHKERYEQLLDTHWDLMIVDEAHHLVWNEEKPSTAYQCIEALARKIEGLLLLTATPEQLGVESHFARLRLLDPDRYHDLQLFCEEEAGYQPVSNLVLQLLEDDAKQKITEDKQFQESVVQYLGNDVLTDLLHSSDFSQSSQKAVNHLLDCHGTGRILFRNTRDAVEGFPERVFYPHPLPIPESYQNNLEQASLTDLLQAERIMGDDWLENDSRVKWLSDWLMKQGQHKILVICAQADTARDLELFLRLKSGFKTSVFHEGLSLINRDRAAAYFADEEDGAQVMICSEIGSEGRNFQFSHHLVLFDLPLNPDLLEQRIGRLDRIGQKHTVQIHLPYYENSAQAILQDWYHQGLNAFQQVFPAGGSLYSLMESTLEHCLTNSHDAVEINKLIQSTQSLKNETSKILQDGRDRLLELNSCNKVEAQQLIFQLNEASQPLELALFMDNVFDAFGVEQQTHSADTIIISPGTHMEFHQFPSLPEDGLTGTFQRSKALVREDMAFLTWEHPMVTGAMDMLINGDFGNSAFCTLENDDFSPGTLLIEAIFRIQCPAPAYLQLNRYLTHSYLRLVTNEQGKVFDTLLPEVLFNQQVGRIPKTTAQELVRRARPQISTLITQAKQLAQTRQDEIVSNAISLMQSELMDESQRLTALAKINPNIRQQEIDYLQQNQSQLESYLSNAQLALDALRIAITTEVS